MTGLVACMGGRRCVHGGRVATSHCDQFGSKYDYNYEFFEWYHREQDNSKPCNFCECDPFKMQSIFLVVNQVLSNPV